MRIITVEFSAQVGIFIMQPKYLSLRENYVMGTKKRMKFRGSLWLLENGDFSTEGEVSAMIS